MSSKTKFKLQDTVKVINETLRGTVTAINHDRITIACEDGFQYTFLDTEIVPHREWSPLIKVTGKEKQEKGKDKKIKTKTKKGVHYREIDLHIHALTTSEAGMSGFDKINLQLDTAKKALENAIKNKQQRIVFIHGYGTGTLRKELRSFLRHYPVTFHDGSYLEYGQGATEVIIFQHKK